MLRVGNLEGRCLKSRVRILMPKVSRVGSSLKLASCKAELIAPRY